MTALPNHVPPAQRRVPVADAPSYATEPHPPRMPVVRQASLRSVVFTTGQVAYICKVASRTVSKWFDSGLLKGYLIPGSNDRRIPREALIQFMRQYGLPLGALDDCNTLLRRVLLLGLSPQTTSLLQQYLPPSETLLYALAGDGFEAGLRVSEHTYRVVVIDLSLGRTEGLRIAQTLRRKPEYRSGDALLLALACEDEQAPEQLTEGGVFDWVIGQPVDVGVLAEHVRAWVMEGVEP